MSAGGADEVGESAARSLKFCIIGEPGVGKSSLAQRLLHDRFPAMPSGPGIRVTAHRLRDASGDEIALTVWDVAAASAIDTLGQAFLSGVDVVAGVAVAGDHAGAERAGALIRQVRRLHPRARAALWLNKSDLAPGDDAAPVDGIAATRVSALDRRGLEAALLRLLDRAVPDA